MTLQNKLNITDPATRAQAEERITKQKALQLFENGLLDAFDVGTYKGLAEIHKHLFEDIYAFAGAIRSHNIAKGNFRFASVRYLEQALEQIDRMPQSTFDQIVEKYVEMNIAHPFREGNGRSTRIWLDCMLRQELGVVVDWSCIEKNDYLRAMERSPVWDLGIKTLLESALTNRTADRTVYTKGIDASYAYEGLEMYKTGEIGRKPQPQER